jgi:hypothetical protein
MNATAEWASFYVLVGSAAAALIGLQFVLMALIAEMPSTALLGQASSAFGTPNIVNFGASLLISGILSAPWRSIGPAAAACGWTGVAGVAYSLVVAARMRRQTAYRPELSDWFFYLALPFAAYAALAAFGRAAAKGSQDALFGVAAAALLLLFIGIHNAWDSVTYHIFVQRPAQPPITP